LFRPSTEDRDVDYRKFDRLTRSLAPSRSQRSLLSSLTAGIAAVAGRNQIDIALPRDAGVLSSGHSDFKDIQDSREGSCPPGTALCEGVCVLPNSFHYDANNCGSCGHSCGPHGYCATGLCFCETGYLACGGSCYPVGNLLSDAENCGSCGTACASGQTCLDGICGGSSGSVLV
jgi:hypothetical protein